MKIYAYLNRIDLAAILFNVIEWLLAVMSAVFILNFTIIFYYYPPHEIPRSNGATSGIFFPQKWCIADEGYGFHGIDSRGYVNLEKELGCNYILAIGSSHTEGFQVGGKSRWSDLLDGYMGEEEAYNVYNIGHSGFYFPEIVKRFNCITEEFPNSTAMVIEITDTEFSCEALHSALEQSDSSHIQTADSLISSLAARERLVIRFKQAFPIFRLMRKQLIAIKNNSFKEMDDITNKNVYWNERGGGTGKA